MDCLNMQRSSCRIMEMMKLLLLLLSMMTLNDDEDDNDRGDDEKVDELLMEMIVFEEEGWDTLDSVYTMTEVKREQRVGEGPVNLLAGGYGTREKVDAGDGEVSKSFALLLLIWKEQRADDHGVSSSQHARSVLRQVKFVLLLLLVTWHEQRSTCALSDARLPRGLRAARRRFGIAHQREDEIRAWRIIQVGPRAEEGMRVEGQGRV
eukprot:756172-Hanusia_phi.AAC.2